MPAIAYLANQFPSPLEPYVVDEIVELRKRGAQIIPCSAWKAQPSLSAALACWAQETLYLQPIRWGLLLNALWLCCRQAGALRDLLQRIFLEGNESSLCRFKALLHTWLGAYFALLLQDRGVEHIHVHHGYFSAWIALVAARLLGIGYSLTLHGSDLLLYHSYLDVKLSNCTVCFTVSEYNCNYIRQHYSGLPQNKLVLRRLGVDLPGKTGLSKHARNGCLVLLSPGRLHPIKNHGFLVEACALLRAKQTGFLCLIVGDGPERKRLERQIKRLGLQDGVQLLGQVPADELASLYKRVDMVVLTSRSEGIPVVLMEAMARGVPVLAPAITGIPELVRDGETGFLYRPGSIVDFVSRVELIRNSRTALEVVTQAAREHILANFNRETNLQAFCETLLQRISPEIIPCHENPVLQQI